MSELHTITTDVLNPVVPAIQEHIELKPVTDLSIIATHFGDIEVDEIPSEYGE